MKTAFCKGCGAEIVWGDQDGKKIPLDPRPAVYLVSEDTETGLIKAYREHRAMVSHFNVCPKASSFSKKGGRAHAGTD